MMHLWRWILRRLCPLGIPLAWLQLIGEKKRFVTALAGVAFAVTLMMYQFGIYYAVLNKVVVPHRALQGDLVLTSKDYSNFYSNAYFSLRRLYQARSLPEVASIAPVYFDNTRMRNPTTLESKKIYVFGVDPRQDPFQFPEVIRHPEWLQIDEDAFYDALSLSEFGPIGAMLETQDEVRTEGGGVRLRIKNLIHMGGTMTATGNLLVGERAFFRIFPQHPWHMITLGMVRLKPGADPADVARRLERILPPDVRVWTREGLIREEQEYQLQRSPIAFIFLGSMLVAMVVGAVIVYQILYADVNDHLREYATLKAIGLPNRYFSGVVVQESLILLAAGFLPGLGLTASLYHLTRVRAALPIYLTSTIVTTVFVLSLVMCVAAGLLALRRLRSADPADVF
jgi:putative ABC transport system permease protein